MRRPVTILAFVCFVLLSARPGDTASLVIDHTGVTPELLGATGVSVNGMLYDVTFVDGSCVGLFSGCDAPADFTFTTQLDAEAAAQALLDQVFLDLAAPDLFDTEPEFTAGCGSALRCDVWIPFAPGATVDFAAAINEAFEAGDVVGSFFINPATDTGPIEDVVWAQFTAVPEPGLLLLTGLGLAAVLVRRRRRECA
ncbi:MAG: PEP-CTERM sorting domain-containing protein [Vicinamibacterales bacterium]